MSVQLELVPREISRDSVQKWIYQRDEAMVAILKFAGKRFHERAKEFVLDYLREHGETSGETVTDACRAAGIYPPGTDDRAFGPVYHSLSRAGLIEKIGSCQRRKGHWTNGGIVWRATFNVPKG